ncbi:TonB-dependent receptor [Rhodoferax ferrireducens]|uniref:TonB-dependent receptor n=1 Tax=Rhodoferax ferrireducens TaxID=192843 RepID=UPI00298E8180|nr:TonB-dependent receptor [Rhodoferax ferrireducens]WPC68064.1 TonB-dependent receptor [Rhodoferax ferrireducens]
MSPIAAACATLLFATGAVYAQQQEAAELDTVVVTGIRKGIESSIAAKRNSDSIVEAVSAEDIGKLPDTSIADSIARLPGLAAQRVDGRASAISIRGLGPDYAGAVLNGREVVSSGEGRAAEYDQFPSELVKQVIVYKTPDATLIGQGLSGTVDIRPVMPLDSRGRQVVVNVRGEKNSFGQLSPQGADGLGNRVSASYVNQFVDNTVGLAIGFAHLDSPGETKKYEAWKYGDYAGQWGAGATGVPSLGVGNNRAQFAQGFEASVTSSKQVRDGLMAVLEFKPNKDFHSAVDLYYSKFDQDRVSNFWAGDIGLWSGGAKFSNVGTSVVNGNTIIDSGTVDGGRSLVYEKNFHRSDDITSLGWKNELKLADKWTAVADLGYSRANRNETYIQSVAKGLAGGPLTFSGLGSTGNQAWSTSQDLSNVANVQLTNDPNWAEMRTPTYKDEIKSFRLSGKRDLEGGMFSAVETGVNYTQRDKNVQSDAYSLALASANVGIPASALRGPVAINVGGVNASTVSWDVPGVMGLYTVTPKDPWSSQSNKYAVHEKVTTAFAKLNIDTDWGAVPIRGNVGVQAVHTQQNADGFQWNDGATPGAPGSGSLIAINGGTSYNDFLPSLNLAFNLKPDLIARFGLAKAMARPRMDDLRAGADQPKLVENSPGSALGHWTAGGGGKPDLQPWRAKSLDLSLEKYFGKSSYVAGAAFYKKLDSFIYSQETVRDFSAFTNYSPTLTAGCSAANPGCDPNQGTITTQANGQGGSVYGLELSASLEGALLTPALKGFGVIVSESITRNSLPKDKNGNPINLDGFSGIVNNLTFYYEAQGFSTRISQRYRSPFTATTRSVLLGTETSTHIEAEKQLDFQMGYAFESGPYKGLSLLLQVNNLTDAPAVQTRGPEVVGSAGSTTGQLPWKTENFGRSVLLGATYKF